MASGDTNPEASGAVGGASADRTGYPLNSVVAVINTVDQAARTVEALTAGGFLASEIHAAVGQAAADAMHASTGRTGLANLAIRIAERLGLSDDEMESKARYEQALRDGHVVLFVEAASEARTDRAAQILREHGAHSVNYMGRFSRTEIIPPDAPELAP
jgi:hypothetical protein